MRAPKNQLAASTLRVIYCPVKSTFQTQTCGAAANSLLHCNDSPHKQHCPAHPGPDTLVTLVTHCLDVELEDLSITLDPQLQAIITGQVKLQGLGAGPTEAATL